MSKIMVSFNSLWNAHPGKGGNSRFLQNIFPDKTKEQLERLYPNTCCLKLSYALNIAGVRITKEESVAQVKGVIREEERFFVINCISMDKYLNKKGYKPRVWVLESGMPRYLNKAVKELVDTKGIIFFDFRGSPELKKASGGLSYTGHFDLWNGSDAKAGAYFDDNLTKRILLWECHKE